MDQDTVQAGLDGLVSMWKEDRSRQRSVKAWLECHQVFGNLSALSDEAYGVAWRIVEAAVRVFDRDPRLLLLVLSEFLPRLQRELGRSATDPLGQYPPVRMVEGKIVVADLANRMLAFDAKPGPAWLSYGRTSMCNSRVRAEALLAAALLQLGWIEGMPADGAPLDLLIAKIDAVTHDVQVRSSRRPGPRRRSRP